LAECEKCKDEGWVLIKQVQDTVHPGYDIFKALLYVECECKKSA